MLSQARCLLGLMQLSPATTVHLALRCPSPCAGPPFPPRFLLTVTDPAFLVTRSMEDFVTWVDTSRIKRKVMQYNDRLDDYDLMH